MPGGLRVAEGGGGPWAGGQVINVVISGQTGLEDSGELYHSLLPSSQSP